MHRISNVNWWYSMLVLLSNLTRKILPCRRVVDVSKLRRLASRQTWRVITLVRLHGGLWIKNESAACSANCCSDTRVVSRPRSRGRTATIIINSSGGVTKRTEISITTQIETATASWQHDRTSLFLDLFSFVHPLLPCGIHWSACLLGNIVTAPSHKCLRANSTLFVVSGSTLAPAQFFFYRGAALKRVIIASRARAAVTGSTQPSTLRGTVNRVSALWLSNITNSDGCTTGL